MACWRQPTGEQLFKFFLGGEKMCDKKERVERIKKQNAKKIFSSKAALRGEMGKLKKLAQLTLDVDTTLSED